MRNLLLNTVFTLISVIVFSQTEPQQKGPCFSGDCTNGYGYYYNSTTKIVYVGWYKDGLYDGPGYSQNPDGSYVFSNFIKGKANGYSVYDFGKGKGSGMYIMGVKQGNHFLKQQSQTMARKLIVYKDDIIISEKRFEVAAKVTNTCLSGDCTNGFGIKRPTIEQVLIGVFKDGNLVYGEDLNPFTQVTSYREFVTNSTFEYRIYDKSGIEIAGDYSDNNRNGRTVMLKLSEGIIKGAITKAGKVVKRF